ncbi:MAG: molybdate ABC transporter permease subunit [Isosphaeraceae bacterium]
MTADNADAMKLSLIVALLSTVVVCMPGTALAWLTVRKKFTGRGLLVTLLTLPLILPPTVSGYLLLELVGRNKPIGHFLESKLGLVLVFHWSGAVLAAAVTSFPLFFLSARTAFDAVDVSYEQLARMLGASEPGVFRRVTLPLALPGLVAGALLAFVRAAGDFGATLMVAGNIPGRTRTAALALYDATVLGNAGQARGLVAMLSALAMLAIVVSSRLTRKAG